MRLENNVALITGATGGMGSASARLFAQEGAAVAVAARHKDQADALVSEMPDAGGKASADRAPFIDKEKTGDRDASLSAPVLIGRRPASAPVEISCASASRRAWCVR
jgi:NAD(P)-dependent dehydrogenase (short-subunit alcohol dehydrogenase family)